MRKIKKMIASLTAAMMLFSFAAPAMAADAKTAATSKAAIGQDVKGTKYEKDAKKLISLGIINGFEDGTIRPDATVTRAQFAAIVAQELGIAEGVGPATTKFKDVPSSHWASGVINLAVGKGIIYGFGDGTFKPDAPVTYAQAYAMLTQMLGYGPALKGAAWPSGVLAKAASLGVSKGVTGAANAEMKRGDVIKAAANSLDIDMMEQDEWGSDPVYKEKDGKTILSEIFDITIYDGKVGSKENEVKEVKEVPMINLSGLDADEVKLEGSATVYTLNAPYNANDYLGETVEYWVDEDDDVIYYMDSIDEETVITDTVDEVTVASGVYNIALKDIDDDYDVNSDAKIWINIDGEKKKLANLEDNIDDLSAYLEGTAIKVVLDEDDDIKAAVITDYNASASGIVKEVNTGNETVKFLSGSNSKWTTKDFEDTDYVVVKDGAPATLADVKAGDVLNVLDDAADDEYFIVATSKQVKGTADVSWKDDDYVYQLDVTVDDVKYDVNADVTYSDDGNDNIDPMDKDDLKDLNGEEVTLYLDAAGDVRHVVSGAVDGDSSNDLVGVITKEPLYDEKDEDVTLKLVNKAGTELTFTFDPEDVDYNGKELANDTDWNDKFDLAKGDAGKLVVVEYELDSAGQLKNIKPFDGDYDKADSIKVNEDDKTITTDSGDYTITDKTVIFDVTADPSGSKLPDVEVVSWSAIESKDDKLTAAVVTDDDEVDYLFITDAEGSSLTTDGDYAIVTGFTTVDGDDAVKLLLANGEKKSVVLGGTVKDYVYTAHGDKLKKGDFIRFELDSDGELDNAQILGATNLAFDAKAVTDDGETLANFNIEYAINGVVTDSTATSLKVLVNGDSKAEKRYTINDETKFFEVFDTDKLAVTSNVDDDATVVIIDTDDDDRTADFVIVVNEDDVL